jgi:phage terminase small subunit
LPPFKRDFSDFEDCWPRLETKLDICMTAPKPPSHLERTTREWWKSVVDDFDLEPHHLRLLQLAAEAWDSAQAARAVIKKEGMTFTDRFGCPRSRPEVAIERDSRIAFARLLRELALDGVDGPDAARPPRTADYGSRR